MATVESFGAIGDGVTDDTAAFQLAFDSGGDIELNGSNTYRLASLIDIDQSGTQTVTGNNANIVYTSSVSGDKAFLVNKSTGTLIWNNTDIDCNRNVGYLFDLRSPVSFTNVDVQEVYRNGGTAIVYYIEVTSTTSTQGTYTFTNCDATDVESEKNDVLGSAIGASRVWWIVRNAQSDSQVIINGGTAVGIWGDDGDHIQYEDKQSGGVFTNQYFLDISNYTFTDYSRRVFKGTGGHVRFSNCTFNDTNPSNPRLTSVVPGAAMVALGNFFQDERAEEVLLEDCIFNDNGYESRVIPNRSNGLKFHRCTFNGADMDFQGVIGAVDICGSTFNGGAQIIDTLATDEAGDIRIDTGNTAPSGYIQLGDLAYTEVALSCPSSGGGGGDKIYNKNYQVMFSNC